VRDSGGFVTAPRKAFHVVFSAAFLACVCLLFPVRVLPAEAPPDSAFTALKPGDVVRVNIWRQSDLSGEYVIDEDGNLMFPLIGRISTEHVSTDSLRRLLVQQFDYFLKEPFITVTPLFRVNVMGQVAAPGLYNVDATITLADLLAMAGGITDSGSENKIKMVRDNTVIQEDLSVALERGRAIEDIGIRSGDQIVVGKKPFRASNLTMIAAVVTASGVLLSVFLK
jgi:polysaccharide export outer membrane protein